MRTHRRSLSDRNGRRLRKPEKFRKEEQQQRQVRRLSRQQAKRNRKRKSNGAGPEIADPVFEEVVPLRTAEGSMGEAGGTATVRVPVMLASPEMVPVRQLGANADGHEFEYVMKT